jgi:mannose/cellobiose epimerase-like protein (N-acyl-D-glucosamine 2-epimerase family)/membrane-associated phospholipid phosphatase
LVCAASILLCRLPAAAAGDTRGHIDPDWFRRTLTEETAHWRAASVTANGFFQPSIDRQWRPVGKQIATLVSQSRLLFVMATGYEMTREPSYLEALRSGADFLLAHFRDTQQGGWFYSVDSAGQVVDEGKDAYGHAFVIFGLSHAARVTKDQRYTQAALEAWEEMKKRLRDSAGFYKPRTTRDWSQVRGNNSQNPMMHLFEALLALHDATGSKTVFQEAEAHAHNIFTRLFRENGGYLPEQYDASWKPLLLDQRVYLEIGHQFEWAFLLSHAVEKGFPKRYLAIGNRLLDYGMKAGYDAETGGIWSRGNYDGGLHARTPKGWWEQCEFLRALMHYAALRDRTELWERFDKSLAFVKASFIDSEYGGWFNSYDPERPREGGRLNKGSVWQVGYHVGGMYVEALRLSKLSAAGRQGNVASRFAGDVWTDQKAVWSSPFRMNRRRLTHIALPLAAGTAALIATDREAARLLPSTQDQALWSRRVSLAGAAYVLAGAVAAPILAGTLDHRPGAVSVGRSAAEALADSGIVVSVMKPMFWRERPTAEGGKGRFWRGKNTGFPSGHSMMSFAVATAVARNRHAPKWLAITAYTAAVAISFSRWPAQKHFPSDILVGAALGGLIGNYVATRSR